MPNLNEFINPEPVQAPDLEKIEESRPCSQCNKDSEFYYWNSLIMEMTWVCPDGHKNLYRMN